MSARNRSTRPAAIGYVDWMRTMVLAGWMLLTVGGAEATAAPSAAELPMERTELAERVRAEFRHAWSAYRSHAWGTDELLPLTLAGNDWYDNTFLITPVDALDALMLLGFTAEAETTRALIDERLSFDKDVSVQAFEVNIRLLGGLLSSHQLTGDARLLELAQDLGDRLLPAFDSPTGMPYRFVNLRTGETSGPVSNPAEIGTWILELGTLSRLTDDPRYYDAAKNALRQVYGRRSSLDLVGSQIDVESGEWTNRTCHVGGGIDSYFEYLWKGWQLFGDEDLKAMWETHRAALAAHVLVERNGGLWCARVDMDTGEITGTRYGALEAFFAGTLALAGDPETGARLQASNDRMWRLHGLEPERIDFSDLSVPEGGGAYWLRPEIIESAYHLRRATGDERYVADGRVYLDDLIRHCRTDSAYVAVEDVRTMKHADSMDSFFLAETLKYLYLLFAEDGKAELSDAVFTTEAHPLRRTW